MGHLKLSCLTGCGVYIDKKTSNSILTLLNTMCGVISDAFRHCVPGSDKQWVIHLKPRAQNIIQSHLSL